MTIFHSFKFLKYFLIIIIVYNLISLLVLFSPSKSLKFTLWQLMPYDYKYLMDFPLYMNDLSLLNSENRATIKNALNKNISRNILEIDFWNNYLILNNFSREKDKKFEETFFYLFILTKNNKDKQLDLKKYFVSNIIYFSEEKKKLILKNYSQ